MIYYKNLDGKFKKYLEVAIVNTDNYLVLNIFARYRNEDTITEYEFKLLFTYVKKVFEDLINRYILEYKNENPRTGFNYKYAIENFNSFVNYINKNLKTSDTN